VYYQREDLETVATTTSLWRLDSSGRKEKLFEAPGTGWVNLMGDITFLAVGPDDDVYFGTIWTGLHHLSAKTGAISEVEFEVADPTHPLTGMYGVTVDRQGTLFHTDADSTVHAAYPLGDGTYEDYVIAGTRQSRCNGCGLPVWNYTPFPKTFATATTLHHPQGIGVGPNGDLIVSEMFGWMFRITHAGRRAQVVPSASGDELYFFDEQGHHTTTKDSRTGAVRWTFGYDGEVLTSVTDGDGNTTRIERDGAGTPQAIVGPYGDRTTLTLDGNGYLSSVANVLGETYHPTHDPLGLLRSLSDPAQGHAVMTYHDDGRLWTATSPGGHVETFEITDRPAGWDTSLVSGAEPASTYTTSQGLDGTETKSGAFADATAADATRATSGTTTSRLADKSTVTAVPGPDQRFGIQSPIAASVSQLTPGGRSYGSTWSRDVQLASPGDTTKLASETDTLTVGQQRLTATFDGPSRTWSTTTTLGHTHATVLDDEGHLWKTRAPGLAEVVLQYAPDGRLEQIAQGTRLLQYTYDPTVRWAVSTVTDAKQQTTRYFPDAVGRTRAILLPDSDPNAAPTVELSYDATGRLSGVTPPGSAAHLITPDGDGRLSVYQPPVVPDDHVLGIPVTGTEAANNTTYGYDFANHLRKIERPDGFVQFGWEAAQLRTITLPNAHGELTLDYTPPLGQPYIGRVQTMTGPVAEQVAYSYDGPLVTGIDWTDTSSDGAGAQGAVGWQHDNQFRVVGEKVNGSSEVVYSYDGDGVLQRAGALTVSRRDPENRVLATAVGAISDELRWDQFGGRSSYIASGSTGTLYAATYTPDELGRIRTLTETVAGVSRTVTYDYDPRGRLTNISEAGGASVRYAYDLNGNRRSVTDSTGATTVDASATSYDAQDRLVRYGSVVYDHAPAGELKQKTDTATGKVTLYEYDELGSLRSVLLPDGRSVTYTVDGAGRRVRKLVNGTPAQGYLYRDGLRVVAELDGQSDVVARYVWGTRANIPDYVVKGGSTYRIISDHLGSPRLLVDTQSGNIVWQANYDAWGNQTMVTGQADFIPFGFAGGLADPDTRLIRFGARDYDPRVGRWTAKDPLLFGGGSTNLYEYCGGDPVNCIDPNGMLDGVPDWLLYLEDNGWLQMSGDFFAGVASALTLGFSDDLLDAADLSRFGDKESTARFVGEVGGTALQFAAGAEAAEFAVEGRELKYGKDLRVAPFGNRTGDKLGRWPHYHRRGIGNGQGIGRHRPWQTSVNDTSWWSRF
jgi:RHS repeat-associated protein